LKTKVYAVSTGSYSDWRITSMHWTKEDAEKERDAARKRYRDWTDNDDHGSGWCSDPNDTIDEFEIEGNPPPALLAVWQALIGKAG
jgi:hypothetical protein